jgi:hypothetical protein
MRRSTMALYLPEWVGLGWLNHAAESNNVNSRRSPVPVSRFRGVQCIHPCVVCLLWCHSRWDRTSPVGLEDAQHKGAPLVLLLVSGIRARLSRAVKDTDKLWRSVAAKDVGVSQGRATPESNGWIWLSWRVVLLLLLSRLWVRGLIPFPLSCCVGAHTICINFFVCSKSLISS